MKIVTTRDIYVGRPIHNAKDGEPDFNAIIPYGMSEPFKIEKGTEILKIDGTEFDRIEDLTDEIVGGEEMYTFKFTDEAQEALFEMLIDCANVTNIDPWAYKIAE